MNWLTGRLTEKEMEKALRAAGITLQPDGCLPIDADMDAVAEILDTAAAAKLQKCGIRAVSN